MLLFLLFSLAKLRRAQFAIYCCVVIASLPGEFLTLFSAGQNSQSVRNRWALWVCREVPYRIRPKIQRHLRKVSCKCFMLFCTSQSMSNNGRKAGATILFLSVIMHRKVEQISHVNFFVVFFYRGLFSLPRNRFFVSSRNTPPYHCYRWMVTPQDFIHVKVTQQLLLSIAMLCPQLLHMHSNYYTYMNYKDNFYHLAQHEKDEVILLPRSVLVLVLSIQAGQVVQHCNLFSLQTFKKEMGEIHSLRKWTSRKSRSNRLAGQAPKIWYISKLKLLMTYYFAFACTWYVVASLIITTKTSSP